MEIWPSKLTFWIRLWREFRLRSTVFDEAPYAGSVLSKHTKRRLWTHSRLQHVRNLLETEEQ